jgi:hypothetical protein
MSRFTQKPDDQPEPPQPAVSRRVMLIASRPRKSWSNLTVRPYPMSYGVTY